MIYSPVTQNQDFHQHHSNSSKSNNLIQKQMTNPALSKKTVLNLCMLANICDLLTKFLDILDISVKPKKL